MPDVLASLASLLWGASDFLGGIGVRGRSAVRLGAMTQPFGLLVVALVLSVVPAHPAAADIWWGVAAGIVSPVGLVALYRALAMGPMNVAAPTAAVVGSAVPVIVGLIGGERPGTVALTGVALGLIAVGLVGVHHEGRSAGRGITTVLALSTGAGAAIGLTVICFAQTSPDSGLWGFGAAKLTALVVLGSIAFFTDPPDADAPRRSPWLVPAVGLADTGATIAILIALQHGSLVLVAVLGGLYPVVTVLLARLFLGERLTRPQLVGLAVAAVAIVMMTT